MAPPDPQTAMQLGSLADWVAGVSTFLAVLVALFKEDIVRWRRQPRLVASISLAPPDCTRTLVHYTVQRVAPTAVAAESYYLRLWVHNRGKTRAEKVQVFAERLFKRSADQSFKPVDGFLPMNLLWAHAQGLPEVFADGISPQMGKHCDLGHVHHPASRVELGEALNDVSPEKTVLALELEVKPNTLSHLIAPGVYRLALRVAAANCAPVPVTLELTITGDWFTDEDQMFSEGLGVRVC